jgi:hypothetical protein
MEPLTFCVACKKNYFKFKFYEMVGKGKKYALDNTI